MLPLLLYLLCPADSARVLAVVPMFGPSHQQIIQPILRTIARAGHHLTMFSPIPLEPPEPNITEIILETAFPEGFNLDSEVEKLMKTPYWKAMNSILPFHEIYLNSVFYNDNINQLLRSGGSYDLVITESFVAQEFSLIFGHVFNAPTIIISTLVTNHILQVNLGNPLSIATIPDWGMPFTNKMTFMERAYNGFSILWSMYEYHYIYLPTLEMKTRVYIPNMPSLRDLLRNVSLVFTNDHLTGHYPHPRLPNMIPVAGIHLECDKTGHLPTDMQRFMDGASDGVILFSTGTYIPDDLQTEDYFNKYIQVFKSLPQRVLWKSRKRITKGLPVNVLMAPWLPQRAILDHPNCVLFITHGGLASQIETIYSGVPVVGIAHLADQHRNVQYFVAKGVGVALALGDVTETSLRAAILAVIGNPKYKSNMLKLSATWKDRPLTPTQSVVYWTEYVIRHRGAKHLQSSSLDLTWYQDGLLDVLLVGLSTVIIVIGVIFIVVRKLFLSLLVGNYTSTRKKTL